MQVAKKLMLHQLKTLLLGYLSLELLGLILIGRGSSVLLNSNLTGILSNLQADSLTAAAQSIPVETIPSYVELNVPYFSQLDNELNPRGSSAVTALAMVLAYYGIQPQKRHRLADEMYDWMINQGLEKYAPYDQVKLIQQYGLQDNFKEKTTWAEILEALRNGQPVVVHGYFTNYGHVVTLVGYTPTHVIVNDPYGDAMTGYVNQDGQKVLYPIDFVLKALNGDGSGIWAHFITP